MDIGCKTLATIAGAELITCNNLITVSVLGGKAGVCGLLSNWTIVYFANLIRSLFLVLIMYRSELWKTNSSQFLRPAIGIPVAGTPSI